MTGRQRPGSPSRPAAARGAALPWMALWLAAALLCGCAAPVLLTYRPDEPLSANLPLQQAGVRDDRAAFAAVFAQALQAPTGADLARAQSADARADAAPRAGLPGGPAVTLAAWLHLGVPAVPAQAGALASPQALEQRFRARSPSTAVMLVPGLFGDCVDDQSVPFGDGAVRAPAEQARQAYAGYADLGLHSIRLVRLPGRRSVADNGLRLAEALRAAATEPGVEHIVLVAYSKGAADALQALRLLRHDDAVLRRVAALVSVAGVVMGTPLADFARPVYDAVAPYLEPLGCSASDGEELASITRLARARWLAEEPSVAGPAYYTVLAYAAPDEMALPLRASHAWLARADPRNDGQLLAGDAVLPGSHLLAAARSDHWDLALPRDRHPNAAVRALGSGRAYPREALFRALMRWVVGHLP